MRSSGTLVKSKIPERYWQMHWEREDSEETHAIWPRFWTGSRHVKLLLAPHSYKNLISNRKPAAQNFKRAPLVAREAALCGATSYKTHLLRPNVQRRVAWHRDQEPGQSPMERLGRGTAESRQTRAQLTSHSFYRNARGGRRPSPHLSHRRSSRRTSPSIGLSGSAACPDNAQTGHASTDPLRPLAVQ
jgi:hypothetical protein